MAEQKQRNALVSNFRANSWFGKPGVDFLRPNRVKFTLSKIDGAMASPTSKINSLITAEVISMLENNLISVTVPQISIDVQDGAWNRNSIKDRGKGELTATFYESNDFRIRDFFYKWIELMVTRKGPTTLTMRHFPADVYANIIISPLNNDYNTGKKYDKFECCIPTSVGDLAYNFEESDKIGETTVSFKYKFHNVMED